MGEKNLLNASQTVRFNAGNTISEEFNSLKKSVVAVDLPTWDGGKLILQSKVDIDATFKNVYDSAGSAVEIVTAGAGNKIIGLTSTHLQAVIELRFLRFKTDVAPSTAVTITVLLK